MFQFERKLTENEFVDLKKTLLEVFWLKVDEKNIHYYVDKLFYQDGLEYFPETYKDGNPVPYDKRVVSVELDYTTPSDIAKRFGYGDVAEEFETIYRPTDDPMQFYIVTDEKPRPDGQGTVYKFKKVRMLGQSSILHATGPLMEEGLLYQLRSKHDRDKEMAWASQYADVSYSYLRTCDTILNN